MILTANQMSNVNITHHRVRLDVLSYKRNQLLVQFGTGGITFGASHRMITLDMTGQGVAFGR